jgi:hypothetical protein
MLCAFFDVQAATAEGGAHGGSAGPKFKVRGRSKKAAKQQPEAAAQVRPSESAVTVMHAQFEALPRERNVPKAYEAELYELSDDDAPPDDEQWDYVRQDADKEEAFEEDADDLELPEDDMSLASDASELSTSFDDSKSVLLRSKRSKTAAADQKAVYAGPQLCLEDDDFLD